MQYEWGPNIEQETETNTLAAQTYNKIRQDIISGSLEPGSKLQSEKLKKQYDVGSSPLREALTQLAANGLVTSEGQKGFRVVDVSLKELRDITKLRMHLEVHGFKESIAHGDVEWEVAVTSAYRRLVHAIEELSSGKSGSARSWEDIHRGFHLSLVQGCGSPWLISFCHRLYEHFERYRRIYVEYREISPKILEEHEALHQAAINRDADLAEKLLSEHILFAARLTEADARKKGIQDGGEIIAAAEQEMELIK
ncbi:MAG: FCD domain-containing protein [Rhodospirillaceae bacterium]|nr:FCD domain-containing protein [Rhodospirillaceae bacterium]MBT4939092.1 FCD domain-containing protein [Rhodospirillaceae bacterium]MBT5938373.1 FCD domain-containing protein [Rhodospirillaceae bacterium]MBT7265412.1 FCD domain-containing protein [Rhodospirillaceae bacterium]